MTDKEFNDLKSKIKQMREEMWVRSHFDTITNCTIDDFLEDVISVIDKHRFTSKLLGDDYYDNF